MRSLLLFLVLITSSGYSQSLKGLDKNVYPLHHPLTTGVSVFVWVSPECPLCQNYTLPLRALNKKYGSKINLFGIVPGSDFKRKNLIYFKHKYRIDFPLLLDPDYTFTKKLNAKVTPEVVVYFNGTETYRGAIDNWAVSLGKHRQKATSFFLEDAISAALNNQTPTIQNTDPIGCYIYALPH